MLMHNTICCGVMRFILNSVKYLVYCKKKWYHIFMKIEIVRQKRKTISLKLIDSQNAVLKVPTKLSEQEVQKFLSEKKRWIEKGITKFQAKESFAHDFDLKNKAYLNGDYVADFKDLVIGFENMNAQAQERARKRYYLSNFYKLVEMTNSVSEKSGLTYNDIKSVSSVKVWGSYNAKRVMKLNWKLVIVPKELAYYVICHELSHSKHFNHKPQFWAEVEKLCPDFKEKRRYLDQYSFLLKENI